MKRTNKIIALIMSIVLLLSLPFTATATDKDVPANPTAAKVIINGKTVDFEAYNIYDNNYFKLRDVAKAITGTEKQFEVTWNGEKNLINLVSNKAYTTVGGELALGDGVQKKGVLCSSAIMKDCKECHLTAYTINDNNFFKLRDLGELFDFGVDWDGTNIIIDTSKSYIADTAQTDSTSKTKAFITLRDYIIENGELINNMYLYGHSFSTNNEAFEFAFLYFPSYDLIELTLNINTQAGFEETLALDIKGLENENYEMMTEVILPKTKTAMYGWYTINPESITKDYELALESYDVHMDDKSITNDLPDDTLVSTIVALDKMANLRFPMVLVLLDTQLKNNGTGLTIKDFGFTNFVY